MYSLRALGGACLQDDSGTISGPAAQRRRLAILALLAASPTGQMSRDKLTAYLWPEADAERARGLLGDALYALRKALGKDAILASGEELRLNPQRIRTDVAEFRDALAHGERERAVELYQGPFLDGFFIPDAPDFERWVETEREHFARSYAQAIEELAEEREAEADWAAAVRWWRRLSAAQPYDGRVARRLVEALEAAGDRAGAIVHVQVHTALLADLEVEPNSELLQLAERLRSERTPRENRAGGGIVQKNDAELSSDSVGRSLPDPNVPVPATGARSASNPPATLDEQPARPAEPARSPRSGLIRAGQTVLLLSLVGLGWFLWRQTVGPREAPTTAGITIVSPAPEFSLAVLPLKNYSGDPAQEYFADGMTAELITTLTKIEALRVIAHQSVLQFKHSEQPVPEIARLLEVGYVLEASVVQEGERVRITANLIDAANNTSIWGERFERERRDILALQRKVALAIARQIEITLTPQDRARLADAPRVDPEAFDLYLKGTQARYEQTPAAYRQAQEYFERAIARDSGHAPAYAGLASVRFFSDDPAEARRLAEKAIELDPGLAEPHIVLGLVRQHYDFDWDGAEEAFRRAIQLDPGYAEARHELSMLLMRLKRFDEALREARHTLYLAPTSARFQHGLEEVFLFSGRYDEALAAAERALALGGYDLQAHGIRGAAYAKLGRYEEAVEALQKCVPVLGDVAQGWLGNVYAAWGRRKEALELLEEMKSRRRNGSDMGGSTTYGIALVYAGLGEREQALDWLERTPKQALAYVAIDPSFRSLHGEPRFHALLKKVGLET